jgi:hypothetical protein
MSHITTINVELRELTALKAACAELGAAFIDNKTTYKWYGECVGDYPLPKGIAADQLGAWQRKYGYSIFKT